MQYEKADLLEYMDAPTIRAILRIYGIPLKYVGFRLGVTKQAVVYQLKHDSMKDWQRLEILDLFYSYGLETLELILIWNMCSKAKEVK